MAKKIIILQPGPRHLFWSTGAYLFWSLKKKYDFIIFVSLDFKKDYLFQKLITHSSVLEVIYYPKKYKFNLKYQFNIIKKIKKILQYKPSLLLQNTINYLEDQYLYHLSKKANKDLLVFVYNPTIFRKKSEVISEHILRKRVHIERLSQKIPFPNNYKIAEFILNLKSMLKTSKVTPIISYLIGGVFINFPFDIYSGYLNKKVINQLNDSNVSYITFTPYFDAELNYYNCKKIYYLVHPAIKNAYQLFKYLNFKKINLNQILILPTYGNIKLSKIKDKGNQNQELKKIANKWLEALKIIKNKVKVNKVFLKLHPAMMNDLHWDEIISYLISKDKDIKIISKNQSAESLILSSKIILGDNSSALWWSSLFQEKITISLDIFDYEGGNFFDNFSNDIIYINDLKSLKKVNFRKSKISKINSRKIKTIQNIL